MNSIKTPPSARHLLESAIASTRLWNPLESKVIQTMVDPSSAGKSRYQLALELGLTEAQYHTQRQALLHRLMGSRQDVEYCTH